MIAPLPCLRHAARTQGRGWGLGLRESCTRRDLFQQFSKSAIIQAIALRRKLP
ncbi:MULTISPECIES: hypothetical protein [unclassified Nostoc]|uniref:hypothetical protein n=1 Tax=unclassified Nostoc TaxID=2593658 RepID=UPI001685BD78|nr:MULTISPECIES: hypothetical protein [unclassified Nostoc]